MERSKEGCRCSRHGRVWIDSGGGYLEHGSRGAIHLVLSMDDEQSIQALCKHRMWSVICLPHGIQHVQKVFSIGQLIPGHIKVSSNAMSVRIRSDSHCLPDDPLDLFVDQHRVIKDARALKGRIGLWMEGGHCSKGADEHAHGMSIIVEGLHQFAQIDVQCRVCHHLGLPVH